MMAWLIPILTVTQFLVSFFRGKGDAWAKMLFVDVIYQSSRLLLVLALLAIGWGLAGVLWAYLLSAALAAGGFLLFAWWRFRHTPTATGIHKQQARSAVLRFSVPLLGFELIGNMSQWIAPLLLGFWSTADQLALYQVPQRLAALISVPILGLMFLFLPVATGHFSRGESGKGENSISTVPSWSSCWHYHWP
jgi:O-antigen/teichoic acid export membrane protein